MASSWISLWTVTVVCACAADGPNPPPVGTTATATPSPAKQTESPWTTDSVQAKLKELENDAKVPEDKKKKATDLLKQALGMFKTAIDWRKTATTYRKSLADAPATLASLREKLAAPPPDPVGDVKDCSLKALEAKASAVKNKQAELAKAAEEAEAALKQRPERRRRLPELKSAAQKKLKELGAPPQSRNDDQTEVVTARQALHAATLRNLTAELDALECEIAFLDGAGDLATLERDWVVRQASFAAKSKTAIDELVLQARRDEAEAAAARAEAARKSQALQHPLLQAVAEQNRAYAEDRKRLTPLLEGLDGQAAKVRKTLADAKAKHSGAHAKVDRSGVNPAIAQELRRIAADATNVPKWHADLATCRRDLDRLQTTLFDLETTRTALADPDAAADELFLRARLDGDAAKRLAAPLAELLKQQKEQLDGSINDHQAALGKLVEVGQTYRDLIDESEKFAAFSAAQTLWQRSAPVLDGDDLAAAARLLPEIGDFGHWRSAVMSIVDDAKRNWRMSALAAAALVFWLALNERMRRRLKKLGEAVDKDYLTTFSLTLRSLLLTMLMSVLAPTLVYYLGWRLQVTATDEFAAAVGCGFQAVALVYATIEVLRQIFRRHGLADSHFRWRSGTVLAVRRVLTLLWPFATVAAFAVGFTEARSNEIWKTSVGRIAFVVGMIAFSYFLHRIMNPNGAILRDAFSNKLDGWFYRLRRLWHIAAVGTPAALAGMAIEGHYFTAMQLTQRLLPSFWALVAVALLNSLALRWLFTARGKLALDRAKTKRDLQDAGEGKAAVALSGDQVDLSTVNKHVRKLFGSGLAVALSLALWMLWADALPAFGPVTQYALWTTEVDRVVATRKPTGEVETSKTTEIARVTALHVALAIGLVWLTVVVAGSLPGVVEVMLYSALPNDAGARYAAATLMRYALSVVGVVAAASVVGVGWSQVQWLVAGMTVGLGFGLQEIFANFVSGVILLFERPIRLGDLVTVGDVTGVVSKIRIRAATIVDQNRRELIVPNKEFITGKVINWTLSDRSARIQIRAGVAYGTDPDFAIKLMIDAAASHPEILTDPAPNALLESFGDSTLEMVMNCYVGNIDSMSRVRHEINAAIVRKFREEGVEYAYPQREVTVHFAGEAPPAVEAVRKRSA